MSTSQMVLQSSFLRVDALLVPAVEAFFFTTYVRNGIMLKHPLDA